MTVAKVFIALLRASSSQSHPEGSTQTWMRMVHPSVGVPRQTSSEWHWPDVSEQLASEPLLSFFQLRGKGRKGRGRKMEKEEEEEDGGGER